MPGPNKLAAMINRTDVLAPMQNFISTGKQWPLALSGYKPLHPQLFDAFAGPTSAIHPGLVGYYHGARPVTLGRRYILASFLFPGEPPLPMVFIDANDFAKKTPLLSLYPIQKTYISQKIYA